MKWLVLVLILAACGPAEYDDVANQTVGLNTTADPKALPKGAHPQFMRLEYTGGAIKPRKGNTTYATPTGTELWLFQQLNVSEVAELHYEGLDPWYAYVAKDGGTVTVRDHNAATEALNFASPAVTPNFVRFYATLDQNGLAVGETRVYAAAYYGALTPRYTTGLGPVVSVTNDALKISLTYAGTAPAADVVITNTTRSCTATVHYASVGGGTGFLLIRGSGKSVTGAWQNTDALTWSGGTGTMTANEEAVRALPGFTRPSETAPTGAVLWNLYALDASGYWRKTNMEGHALDADTRYDNTYFPYSNSAQSISLDLYDNPLDTQDLPETLLALASIGNAQSVVVHKGSLFVAIGREIYASEPTKYRTFRDGYSLSARDTVLKMVSVPINKGLDYILQVFTPTGMQFIIGESPNWEIRHSNITEGPVARYSIAPSDVGTWALYDDGLYLIASVDRVNVTRGVNDTWIRNMSTPSAAVGAADKGIYRLVDNAGKVLGYDWETKQFFEDTFSAKPDGFLYRDAARALVAKIGSTYTKVGTTAAAVSWTLELPTGFSGMQSQTPGYLYLDAAGDMTLTYYVDGELLATFTLDPSDEPDHLIPLLQDRGFTWRIVLSGSGQASDTVLRAWAFR